MSHDITIPLSAFQLPPTNLPEAPSYKGLELPESSKSSFSGFNSDLNFQELPGSPSVQSKPSKNISFLRRKALKKRLNEERDAAQSHVEKTMRESMAEQYWEGREIGMVNDRSM